MLTSKSSKLLVLKKQPLYICCLGNVNCSSNEKWFVIVPPNNYNISIPKTSNGKEWVIVNPITNLSTYINPITHHRVERMTIDEKTILSLNFFRFSFKEQQIYCDFNLFNNSSHSTLSINLYFNGNVGLINNDFEILPLNKNFNGIVDKIIEKINNFYC